MRKYLYILTIVLTTTICSCGPNKKSPEYVARQYLTALRNKDWETAKIYSTKEARLNIDMMASLGSDFRITEIKDIECRKRGNNAICTFCCSEDTGFKQIYLVMQDDGQWFQHHPKAVELWNF